MRSRPFIRRFAMLPAGLLVAGCLAAAEAQAQAQSEPFGPMSPADLGQGGGGGSDIQKLREEMVQKMKNGTYADIVRQGRDNAKVMERPRSR